METNDGHQMPGISICARRLVVGAMAGPRRRAQIKLEMLVRAGLRTQLGDRAALTAAIATPGRWNGGVEAQIAAGPVTARRLGVMDERGSAWHSKRC